MIVSLAAEWSTAVTRDHVRDNDVATPALLCHKEPVPIIGSFRAWRPPFPYAIKNQLGASRGLWMRRGGSLWHKRADIATS